MRQGVSRSYLCLPLKTSNFGWHNHWFYVRDDAAAPLPPFSSTALVRLDLWSWGCGKKRSSKVTKILEILEGWVSAGLDGVMVLRTMIERRVQPLKRRGPLLCDYSGVEDPTRETMEMLDASKVMRWVGGLSSSRTVVAAECAVEAFSATHRPNLVSCLDSFFVSSLKVVS